MLSGLPKAMETTSLNDRDKIEEKLHGADENRGVAIAVLIVLAPFIGVGIAAALLFH